MTFRSNPYISESEILLALSYLMGDASEKYGCLQRVACEDPKKSKEYLSGAKMLIKGAQFFYKLVLTYLYNNYTKFINLKISIFILFFFLISLAWREQLTLTFFSI